MHRPFTPWTLRQAWNARTTFLAFAQLVPEAVIAVTYVGPKVRSWPLIEHVAAAVAVGPADALAVAPSTTRTTAGARPRDRRERMDGNLAADRAPGYGRPVRGAALRLTIAAVLLAVAPAAASACGELKNADAHARPAPGVRAPLVVGDSTMIFATPVLGRLGFQADAHGCRQYDAGVGILRARVARHTLPRLAVLALGANGPVRLGTIQATLRAIGSTHVLGLVTPRHAAGSAAAMRAAGRRFPPRVLVADWASFSAPHGSWFAGDGLHVNVTGARAYAQFIRRAARPFFMPASLRRLAAGGAAGKRCATVHVGGRTLHVSVERGRTRITCTDARAIARRAPLRRRSDWSAYDGRGAGLTGVADVFARAGGRVVVVTRV